MRNRWWAMPVLAAGAAVLAACGSSAAPSGGGGSSAPATQRPGGSGTNTAAGTVTIETHSSKLGTVLTNAKGRTLYWFAIDTPTKSNCTGSCTTYWPPVMGKAVAAAGTTLPHGFGTITRSGGGVQATYDGHPLYTYAADTGPGQVGGNDLNLSGGLWWAMTPTGAKPSAAPAGSSSSSPASSGGGY
jgi:predicted lipoprotein with Yx(FWY)xxD motif